MEIVCRHCKENDCTGCNLFILVNMLEKGDFDFLMNEHKSIEPLRIMQLKKGEKQMITNKRDYLKIKHSVLIEIHSEPNKTTFIKYEETTEELNMIMTGLFEDLLEHLKTHKIINDYAISSF